MRAIIVAARLGTRRPELRPELPAPRLRASGQPILAQLVERDIQAGIRDIFFTGIYLLICG